MTSYVIVTIVTVLGESHEVDGGEHCDKVRAHRNKRLNTSERAASGSGQFASVPLSLLFWLHTHDSIHQKSPRVPGPHGQVVLNVSD